jgi:hypothetical protein
LEREGEREKRERERERGVIWRQRGRAVEIGERYI